MRDYGGLILLALLIVVAALGFSRFLEEETAQLQEKIQQLEQEIEAQELQLQTTRELIQEVKQLRSENEELRRQMQDWLDAWDITEAEVTMYAPLDPAAVDGWDYCGDPNITASGARVEIGVTVAAGPSIPFGTVVLVQGMGMFEVQDRGGLIRDGCLDIAVSSRKMALAWGRQQVKVAYLGVD